MSIAASLLPEFDQEMANTRKVLARCPDDKFAFTPHAKSWNMGSLATHIVNMLGWTIAVIAQDSFDVAPVGAPPYREEPVKSNSELLERFDKNVTAARAALAGASDETLQAQWSLLQGGQKLFSKTEADLPAVRHPQPYDPPSWAALRLLANERHSGARPLRPVCRRGLNFEQYCLATNLPI